MTESVQRKILEAIIDEARLPFGHIELESLREYLLRIGFLSHSKMLAAVQAIETAGAMLGRCERPSCGRLFLRVRAGRGDYCSKKCGQNERAKKFYSKNRQKIGEQRKARRETR